jgi:hypothetical protein
MNKASDRLEEIQKTIKEYVEGNIAQHVGSSLELFRRTLRMGSFYSPGSATFGIRRISICR